MKKFNTAKSTTRKIYTKKNNNINRKDQPSQWKSANLFSKIIQITRKLLIDASKLYSVDYIPDTPELRTPQLWTKTPALIVLFAKITLDHILWNCKETEIKRLQMNITIKIWKRGKEEMGKLLQYSKEIGLYNGKWSKHKKKEDKKKSVNKWTSG
jgi:hypothetical protein